jgi:uncharacterized phage protein (TIGR01671 family)
MKNNKTREIKFRAWDSKNNKMILSEEYNTGAVINLEGNSAYTFWELNQYTGLKGKDDVEIYEGDVVEFETNHYDNKKIHRIAVEWQGWYSDDFGEPCYIGFKNVNWGMTVIGNIYQNPELINN